METTVSGKPIRVLLVDDHTLFRRGIANLLASQPYITVVGEASDGWEALEKARESTPDLILLDLRMPGLDGQKVIQRLKDIVPSSRIIVLTISENEEDLLEAIREGANGYLLKDLTPEELFQAIKRTFQGEPVISPRMASKMLTEFSRRLSGSEAQPLRQLTSREKEILLLLAEGARNKEISARLHISGSTVRNHIHHIIGKLHVQNRVQAALLARGQAPQGVGAMKGG